jgi:Transcriptional regulators
MISLELDPRRGQPLYQQISDQIESAVAEGRLSAGQVVWSARQIAAHYRISYQTAERALSDLAQKGVLLRAVGRGTRVAGGERQQAPAPQRVSPLQRVRPVKSRVIAMLNCWQVFDGQHTLYTLSELREIQAAAQELTLRMWGMLFASFSTEQFTVSHLADWARQHAFDGVLVFGELPAPALRWLEREGYGVVVVDAEPANSTCPRVIQDNRGGIEQVMAYLVEQGHRRIGFLRGKEAYHYDVRQAAYEEACARHGLDREPGLIATIQRPRMTVADAVDSLLRERPTAIVMGSDILAAFALRELQERGVRVPEEVSLVGFDDEPFCQTLAPPLTTVHIPFEELGRRGARLLLDRLEGVDDLPDEIIVPARLVQRQSVRRIN